MADVEAAAAAPALALTGRAAMSNVPTPPTALRRPTTSGAAARPAVRRTASAPSRAGAPAASAAAAAAAPTSSAAAVAQRRASVAAMPRGRLGVRVPPAPAALERMDSQVACGVDVEAPRIFELPHDIGVRIMAQLPRAAFLSAACTCSVLAEWASDEGMWRERFLDLFGAGLAHECAEREASAPLTWKRRYAAMVAERKQWKGCALQVMERRVKRDVGLTDIHFVERANCVVHRLPGTMRSFLVDWDALDDPKAQPLLMASQQVPSAGRSYRASCVMAGDVLCAAEGIDEASSSNSFASTAPAVPGVTQPKESAIMMIDHATLTTISSLDVAHDVPALHAVEALLFVGVNRASPARLARAFDTRSMREVLSFPGTASGFDFGFTDGLLVASDRRKGVLLFDIRSPAKALQRLSPPASAIAASHGRVALGFPDGVGRVVHLTRPVESFRIRTHRSYMQALTMDAHRVVAGDARGVVSFHDLHGAAERDSKQRQYLKTEVHSWVMTLDMSADGEQIACASNTLVCVIRPSRGGAPPKARGGGDDDADDDDDADAVDDDDDAADDDADADADDAHVNADDE